MPRLRTRTKLPLPPLALPQWPLLGTVQSVRPVPLATLAVGHSLSAAIDATV